MSFCLITQKREEIRPSSESASMEMEFKRPKYIQDEKEPIEFNVARVLFRFRLCGLAPRKMTAALKVIYEGREYPNFEFGANLKSVLPNANEIEWLSAEFDPPLKIVSGDDIHFVHFKDFTFYGNDGYFALPELKAVRVSDDQVREIKMIVSGIKPYPFLNIELNNRLTLIDEACWAHVFYFPSDETNLSIEKATFLTSVNSTWDGLVVTINAVLAESEKGSHGPVVGIMNEPGKVPKFLPLNRFFNRENLNSFGQRIMVIFISSFKEFTLRYGDRIVSSKDIPLVLQKLICQKVSSDLLNGSMNLNPFSRRLFKTLFNGGIPVSFLDKYPGLLRNENFPSEQVFLSSSDFDKVVLKLSLSRNLEYATYLGNSIENLKLYLTKTSNEATLRSLFWDRIISDLFLLERGRTRFQLKSEWSTTELFPKLTARRVDFVASIKPNEKHFPIFLAEIGTEAFSENAPHKDFSKLLGTMSLVCNAMAYDLSSHGKSPLNARVYGVWIGGGTIQFVVAHPILTSIPGDMFDVHCNITYEDHWFFDLFSSGQLSRNCNGPCCNNEVSEPAESILQTNTRLSGLIPTTTQDIDIEIEDSDSDSDSHAIVTPQAIEQTSLSNAEMMFGSPLRTASGTVDLTSMYQGSMNIQVFRKLHSFIKIIVNRISLIMNEQVNVVPIKVKPPGDYGENSQARKSTTSENTPSNFSVGRPHQVGTSNSRHNTSSPTNRQPKRTHRKLNASKLEYEISCELSRTYNVFPRLYSYEVQSDGQYTLEFESLEPLSDKNDFISKVLHNTDPFDTLFECFAFGLQSIYGLYLLHEKAQLIHSDISPSNIMFSENDDCWKLIDFGQSMKISDSLSLQRVAGTNGYICPESQTTGIYNQASDIYALGKVFFDYPVSLLIKKFMMKDDPSFTKEDIKSVNSFTRVALSMRNFDSKNRPSALKALTVLFDAFDRLFDYEKIKYPILASIQILITQKREEIRPSSESASMEMEFKRPKYIQDEKEPIEFNVANVYERNI